MNYKKVKDKIFISINKNELINETLLNLAEKEKYSELDAYEIKWSHAKKHLQCRLIDNFLNSVKNIWICPASGIPLKFSKV